MRAIFWTNASVAIGGGHVRRCLSLADALSEAGWDCCFAVCAEALAAAPMLQRSGYDIIVVEASDSPDGLRRATAKGRDLLVIDHYGLDGAFETGCRPLVDRILVIDDLASRRHDCDDLLDYSGGRDPQDYADLVPAGCRILSGLQYAILPPDFFARRAEALPQRETGEVRRILLSFGLVDAGNATVLALDGLADAGLKNVEVDIVLGGGSPHIAAARAAAADHPLPVTVHVDVEDMAALMTRADLALGASGTTSWERCCLGLPTIAIVVADNQQGNAGTLMRSGAALCIGRLGEISRHDVATAIRALVDDAAQRRRMARSAATLCDGLGARRVASALAPPVLARDGRPVALRKASWDDCDFMFRLQSAPGARRYSGTPKTPERTEHERWLEGKLSDPGCIFNVVMHGGEDAGVLRYDKNKSGQWIVSILIDQRSQQLGLASAALALGRHLLPAEVQIAIVHPENTASVRLFERAGFQWREGQAYVLQPDPLRMKSAAGA